jgi:hypothetical protein
MFQHQFKYHATMAISGRMRRGRNGQVRREAKRREIPLCAGRPFHRSERIRKNRPASLGMTGEVEVGVYVGAEAPTPKAEAKG